MSDISDKLGDLLREFHATYNILLRDGDVAVLATLGFLNCLCNWLMLIQLQALAAVSKQESTPGATIPV